MGCRDKWPSVICNTNVRNLDGSVGQTSAWPSLIGRQSAMRISSSSRLYYSITSTISAATSTCIFDQKRMNRSSMAQRYEATVGFWAGLPASFSAHFEYSGENLDPGIRSKLPNA